jgi:transposase InsO family protein
MELWQMDVTASLFLADGRERKVITGIDDHSRFCVIAAVVMRATGRTTCLAFTTAMAEYGIPGEVLSDSKQFTGRFGKPRPYNTRRPHQSLAMAYPHRRARYHRHRGPHHQPRHPTAQGL